MAAKKKRSKTKRKNGFYAVRGGTWKSSAPAKKPPAKKSVNATLAYCGHYCGGAWVSSPASECEHK